MALQKMPTFAGGGGNAPKLDRFTASTSTFHTTDCDFTVKEVIISAKMTSNSFAVVKYDVENSVIYQSLDGADFSVTTNWNGYLSCSGNTISIKAVNAYWAVPFCLIASDQHFS